ncbi:oligosaccharide flippase family protein [Caenispirillum bisanense]|uniref:oligosaccharide flippase family protein n=1 Tax=Caenispirillum bisanense TaxID=414052 RepID=UPI0031E3EBA9
MPEAAPPAGRAAVSRTVVLRASAWALGSRWIVRLLGLISTIVLARLLTPEDFGLVSMAMIILAFTEAVLEFGVRTVLIHHDTLTRDDYDTAWTMNLIQAVLAAAITFALAYPAAVYFDDPRVPPVVMAMAAAMVIGGFQNVGIVDFQRDLSMGRDFLLFVVQKLASVVVAVTLAVLLQSYWALVAGYATARVASVVMSYVLHPYRPRLSLKSLRRFLRMSLWLTVQSVGRFAQLRLDRIIVGGAAGPAALGFYSVASDLANMLVGELLAPVGRALLPAFAALQNQLDRLRAAAEQAISGSAALALPTALGAALTARELIHVVFGEQWVPSVPVFQVVCLTMAVIALRHPVGTLLVAVGRMALSGWGTWAQAGIFAGAWWLWFRDDGLAGVATATLIGAAAFTLVSYARVLQVGLITPLQLLRAVSRPLLATAGMAVVLLSLPPAAVPTVLDFVLRVAVGGVTYTVLLLAAWAVLGRPAGLERIALDMLLSGLRRRRSRAA